MTAEMGTDQRCARYRFYDAAGSPVYFGSAANPEVRWRGHRQADWWPRVDETRTIVDWYPSEREAVRAEYAAIRAERPRFNRNGNPDWAESQRGDRPARWWEYVQRITDGATQATIAERVGVRQSSVARWRATAPKPATVIAFARAYGRPVLEAFVAAGYLSEEDAALTEIQATARDLTDEELIAELQRRMADSR